MTDEEMYQIVSEDSPFDGYYRDELIYLGTIDENLPKPLKAARDLARSSDGRRLSRAELFFKQAKMLADYEDDFDYLKSKRGIVHYYPTYQSLSNKELRAYFSWRTKWRKGIKKETSLSFAFIYVYELIHLIGCTDAEEAYSKLTEFFEDYAIFEPYVCVYATDWQRDFVIYYGLSPTLLTDIVETRKDRALSVLLNIHEQSDDDIFQAVLELSGTTLTSSRMTKKCPDIMKAVVAGTLREVESHYVRKCQNTWIEQYFGYFWRKRICFFERGIFFYQKPTEDREIVLSPASKYYCVHGSWFWDKFEYASECRKRFLDLLRTIDSVVREAMNFPHQIQRKVKTKWIIQTIQEEIQKWKDAEQREELRKRKLDFDLSKLGDIRSDSEVTRDKLLTEEEIEDNAISLKEIKSEVLVADSINSKSNPSNDNVGFNSLSSQEKRYLQCLINGTSVTWVSNEGLLPSLLCDSINDKLYCLFEDTVLEDGVIIEDYTEEVKKDFVHEDTKKNCTNVGEFT